MAYEILFMGTPEFSVPILKSLNSKHKILSVFTQPPKKKSRGQKILKSPIHLEAERLNLPVRFPDSLNNNLDYEFIKESNVKFVIVVAYGQIIPENFLNIKDVIFLNIHASLLPRWRGAAPIQRSIIEMDKETGVSIMKIIPKLDAGPYMLQKSVIIEKKDTFISLSNKLSKLSSELILEALSIFENSQAQFKNQQDKFVTYAKKIKKKESEIDWNEPARNLIAKINGLNPYPGVWFKHKYTRIKIIEAEISNNKGKIGEVLTDDLVVGCLDKSIKITLLQKEGKKTNNAKNFLSGYKILKGEVLF
jgi:methionyl-tRNA formyltransferase